MADLISMLAAAAGSGGPTDPYFNQTTLLLHGDGTNGAQNNTFLDSSTNNFTITRNDNTTQGTFSPFSVGAGEWSNYFDGTGDYLSASGNTAFNPGAQDFTIEAWVYNQTTDTTNRKCIATTRPSTAPVGGWVLYVGTTGYVGIGGWASSSLVLSYDTTSNPIPKNEWTHVAVVKAGSLYTFYINGVASGTTTESSTLDDGPDFYIGREPQSSVRDWNGYISNFRIVKGRDVYTSAFTPPTAPLGATSGGEDPPQGTETSLLTCQSNRFVDNGGLVTKNTITRNGDVRVTPFSPFAPSAAYSASTNGGSGYFDGTGDYLLTTSAAALGIGTSAFTLEGWCYFNNVDTVGAGFGTCAVSADASGDRGVSLFLTGSGAWRFRVGRSVAGQTEDFLGTTTLTAGQWYHFKMVRTSTGSNDTRIYLNGVQEAIGTSTISLNMQKFSVGTYAPSDASVAVLNGYVAGVRFTNTAESSAIPTAPPTAVSGTQYLCNFTNAGIFDNTGKNNLETVGNAQIDTGTKKYGTGSMEFDGNNDYLKLPSNVDFAFNTGDFTIEGWIYRAGEGASGSGAAQIVCDFRTAEPQVNLLIDKQTLTNKFELYVNNANRILSTTDISLNTWYHFAVVRASGSTKLYINGVNEGSTYSDTNNYTSTNLTVGGRFAEVSGDFRSWNGFIDDLRITKGVARYTANFTPPPFPPTAAFPNL